MASVRKSVIVAHTCEEMFDLVDDFERYPEFMPWCRAAEVLESGPDHDVARLQVDYHGLRAQIVTRNAKDRPRRLGLELVEGPFTQLGGAWTFESLGAEGCKVELQLDYTLGGALQGMLAPVFGQMATTMVESFVQRAEAMHAR